MEEKEMRIKESSRLGLSESSGSSVEVDGHDHKNDSSAIQLDELKISSIARRLSQHSRESITSKQDDNVFFAAKGSSLDPKSPNFSAQVWLKALLRLQARDPDKFVGRTVGVALRGLNVFGTSEAAYDFKSTVGNIPLTVFGLVTKMTGLGKKSKIRILRDFDGLLKTGELLLVLGPPG
ncbi:MAG: hypothetical protein MMC33_010210, partial [Icmadophila ericetorum]|nr:hypothetical protein [Icmadophila ericetorum]